MADLRLVYDAFARRWEGTVVAVDQWTVVESVTALLTLARTSDGLAAGFILDADTAHPEYAQSIDQIRELFGNGVAQRVAGTGDTDLDFRVSGESGSLAVARENTAVFPVLGGLDSRSRDVTIVHDEARGIVRVSMRLPWWARFVRPWVTVRRRGRPEVIALGPLKYSRGMHIAEMHYGLPAPTSSLVSEVISGTRASWLSGVVAAVLTAVLIFGGISVFGNERTPTDSQQSETASANTISPDTLAPSTSAPTTTTAPATTTSTTVAVTTTVAVATTAQTTTTTLSASTTLPRRKVATTASTVLPAGGVNFTAPEQYITGNDTRADVTVDRQRVQRGDTINVSVRISGVFINPFDRGGITDLPELIAACRALIGVGVTVSPTPGWSPNVSVSLAGTGVTGGGSVQLVVIGNIATECGDVLISTNPTRINVVRTTFYREVPISLRIPSSLRPGQYSLLLDRLDFNGFIKATPIEITVTE